jgi:putative nucleotidyltransferase with HDIG domain
MKNEIISKIFLELSSFPSFSDAGIKALKLLNKNDVRIEEIERALRYDPGLTANVLKLANSPFFGIPQKIGSLKQAIILLGNKRLAKLVLSVCTSSLMEKELKGYKMPHGDLWRHSVGVSIIAEAVAKKKEISKSADVFTPALLHDIGKVALSNFVEKEYEAINSITSSGVPYEVAENKVLGTDHAEIGSQILRQWSFPSSVVDAVRYHHNPDRLAVQNPQLDIVYISNHLFNTQPKENCYVNMMGSLSQHVINRLGIKFDEFKLLSENTAKMIEKLSDILHLN